MFSFIKYVLYVLICWSKLFYVLATNSLPEKANSEDIIYRYLPVKLSLFSPIELPFSIGKNEFQFHIENFSLGIIYNKADYIYGLAVTSGVFKANYDVIGMSIAPVNLVDSSVLGIQLGLYSQAKQLYGFQSGLYSEVENGNGAQVSFGNNADTIDGAQVAFASNFSKKTNGLQIGIYNNADEVNGVQIGIINYARKVYGSQIGFINVAEESHGLSLGTFFTLDKSNGFIKVFVTFEDQFPFNFGFKIGNKYLYSILEATSNKNTYNDQKVLAMAISNALIVNPYTAFYSLGLGSQLYFNSVFIAAELKWFDIVDENNKDALGKQFSLHYSLLTGMKLTDVLESFLKFSLYDMSLAGKFRLINTLSYLPNENYLFTFGFGVQAFIFNTLK